MTPDMTPIAPITDAIAHAIAHATREASAASETDPPSAAQASGPAGRVEARRRAQ